MPASAAKIVQLSSAEGTWGSTGAMVTKLHGVTDATLKINSAVEVVPSLGWYGPSPIAQEQSHSGEGKLDLIATYEEAPRLFNMFLEAIGQSTITSGAPYIYPYEAPVTSTQAVFTYTIGYGTTGVAYEAAGSIGKHLNIKGEAGGYWNMSVDTLAKLITPATSGMTAMTDRTVNPVRMADTTLYIDAFSTGTIGSSAVSATLISFECDVETNRHLKQFAGSINPADWGDGKFEGTLKLTAEFNASAQTLVDELLGSTGAAVSRQIRIKATEGTSMSIKSMQVDFAGIKSEGETLWSDRDGNMTVDLTFQGRYTTAISNWLNFSVQNGSSSTT